MPNYEIQPIETAPKDRRILVWAYWPGGYEWTPATWREGFQSFDDDCRSPLKGVTHWCELPPDPGTVSEQQDSTKPERIDALVTISRIEGQETMGGFMRIALMGRTCRNVARIEIEMKDVGPALLGLAYTKCTVHLAPDPHAVLREVSNHA